MSPQGPFTRPLAAITGASSGFGRVFAHRLADRGHDLVLVARNGARLQEMASEVAELSESEQVGQIRLNIEALTILSRAAALGMVEHGRGASVRVLCVCPSYTDTGFADRAGAAFSQLPSFMVSNPEHVVDTALRDLDRGRSMSIPGYFNAALAAGSKVSPSWLTRKVSGALTKRTL